MLTYDLSHTNGKPIYEYLYSLIKTDIVTGKLSSGEKLPSKRSFATNLGVSIITIENTYGLLQSEGYIYSIPQKGFFVSSLILFNESAAVSAECISESQSENVSEYDIDLSDNQVDSERFPFTIWSKLLRNQISRNRELLLKRSDGCGIYELRKAIAEHLFSYRGMSVNPGQIVVGAGTEYLYSLIIQLLGRDRIYGLENPGYSKISRIYEKNNVDYRYIDIDTYGLSYDRLASSDVQIAHISPNHHFPTGIVMPISRRHELLNWVNQSDDRYIIEDDYDSEFRFTGRPIESLKNIDTTGKVIYVNTFSRSLTPTIRISYMVLPEKLSERFSRELSFYSCTISNFEQYTLASFIREGYFEKHINRMRLFYSRKQNTITDILKSSLGDKCRIMQSKSGLHMIIRLNTDRTERQIIDYLKANRIRITALSEYYPANSIPSRNMFIIYYSVLDEINLKKACELLKMYI